MSVDGQELWSADRISLLTAEDFVGQMRRGQAGEVVQVPDGSLVVVNLEGRPVPCQAHQESVQTSDTSWEYTLHVWPEELWMWTGERPTGGRVEVDREAGIRRVNDHELTIGGEVCLRCGAESSDDELLLELDCLP